MNQIQSLPTPFLWVGPDQGGPGVPTKGIAEEGGEALLGGEGGEAIAPEEES